MKIPTKRQVEKAKRKVLAELWSLYNVKLAKAVALLYDETPSQTAVVASLRPYDNAIVVASMTPELFAACLKYGRAIIAAEYSDSDTDYQAMPAAAPGTLN